MNHEPGYINKIAILRKKKVIPEFSGTGNARIV